MLHLRKAMRRSSASLTPSLMPYKKAPHLSTQSQQLEGTCTSQGMCNGIAGMHVTDKESMHARRLAPAHQ